MPPPATKRRKQQYYQDVADHGGVGGHQQQQQVPHYANVASFSPASTTTSSRGRGRARRRGGTGARGAGGRIARQSNGGTMTTTTTAGAATANNWHGSATTTRRATGGRPRGRRRGARRSGTAPGRGGHPAMMDDTASVASSTGRRGGGKTTRQSSATAPAATATKPKRPWEGSEDEEDELSKRYGFGRSFLFSEEEEDEEEEEEGVDSDRTQLDSVDDDDEDGTDSKMGVIVVPASSSSYAAPFAHDSEEAEEDDEADEDYFFGADELAQIPPLILSDSSVDLLIYKEHLMDTLEVYEVLLNYGSVLQLSPFLFEDFCAAIRSPRQSRLLCEIHLAFLRLFFREEDAEHTIFAATETTVSVNILIQLMDSMSFGEVLRHYVESDAQQFPADVLHILSTTNYPFVELEKRLRVLKWMCERFFQFDLVKRIVGGTNKTKHDDQCRACGKMGGGFGKLLACAECEAVYHVHCDADIVAAPQAPPQLPPVPASDSEPPPANGSAAPTTAVALPEDDPNWRCPLCRIYVSGITDENCLLPGQISHRNLSRITPVGKDRHGRLYWFMVRRIFVQDPLSGELYYYSTLPQLFDLINHLDPVRYERQLCRRLADLLPSVAMQMHATLELTDQRWRQCCTAAKVPERCPSRPYIHSDNVHRMSRILGTVLLAEQQQQEKEEADKKHAITKLELPAEQPEQQQQHQIGDGENSSNGTTPTAAQIMDDDATTTTVVGDDDDDEKKQEQDNGGGGCNDEGGGTCSKIDVDNDVNGDDNDDDDDEDAKKIDVTTSSNTNNYDDPNTDNNNIVISNNNNNELLQMVKTLLCIKDGHLVATFWSAGMSEIQLLDYCSYFVDIKPPPDELLAREGVPPPGATTADDFWWWRTVPQEVDLLDELNRRLNRGFRLGFSDGVYLQYVNHYSANPDLCRSATARKAERDKRKYMSSRFSITEQGEFSWQMPKGGRFDLYGSTEDVLRCVQLNLRRLVDRMPDALMHRRWVLDGEKGNFLRRLATASDIDTLRDLLMRYEAAIRRPVFLPIWWQSLAATRFIRITSEGRERRQLLENARKKEEKALQQAAESDTHGSAGGVVWVHYTLFGGVPPRHQLWRTMKDEQYRLNGMGELGGWLWVSSTLVRRHTPMPEKPALPIGGGGDIAAEHDGARLATNKAFRLERVAKRLLCWRSLDDENDSPHRTSGVVKAKPLLTKNGAGGATTNSNNNEVLGEQKAFPFPQPQSFKSASGKRSILKLPKWFLKRLARQGGMNPRCSLHFFHQTAKSNPTVWPYPCVRPLFFHCWRYLTSGAQSIHALALRFRLLYACIRWADMDPDPDDEDPRVWSYQADYDEVRMVVSHRENPPDGYYEQYLLKVDQYMVEDEAENDRSALIGAYDEDDSANYRQSSVRERGQGRGTGRGRPRAGRRRQRMEYRGVNSDDYGRARQRAAAAVQQWRAPPRRVRTLTRWIDGVDLKLYEISWYWSDWLRNAMAESARAREEQRRRKALLESAACTSMPSSSSAPMMMMHPQQQPLRVGVNNMLLAARQPPQAPQKAYPILYII